MKKNQFSKAIFSFFIALLVFAWGMRSNAQTPPINIPLCNGSTSSLGGVTMKLKASDFGATTPQTKDLEQDITNGNGLEISLQFGIRFKHALYNAYACPGGFSVNCVSPVYYGLSTSAALSSKAFTINIHEDGASPITAQDVLNIQYYPILNKPLTDPVNTSLSKIFQLALYTFPQPSTDYYYVATGLWNKLAAQYMDTNGPAYSGVTNFILPAGVAMPPPGSHFTLAGFSVGLLGPKGCLWASSPTSITVLP